MPFVQRVVEPKFVSRVQLFDDDGTAKVSDEELQAVTNFTLCSALRQLATLSLAADDIFKDLGGQLKLIYGRSEELKAKLVSLGEKVEKFDPKKVPVPVGDICSFAQTKEHYAAKHPMDTKLFGVDSRPQALKALYEAASRTPVHAMRQLDRWRKDGHRSSKFFVCTPILGAKRRKIRERIDIDIETRMPAVIEDLRRWTSDEALGDITVGPDSTSRIAASTFTDGDATDGTIISDDEGIDHKLPSPEEQLQVVALRFPAEIVAVDISGRSFDRMSSQRRSLMTGQLPTKPTDGEAIKRRGRLRRPRNRRRNTLAGTDQKEIQDVLSAGDLPGSSDAASQERKITSATVPRSKSSDLLRSSHKKDPTDVKISRFNSLKQWGKSQYDKLLNKSNEKSEHTSPSSAGSSRTKVASPEDGVDDFNLYDTVTMKRRKDLNKERKTHARNSSISSSEKSLPVTSSTLSSVVNIAVKLRDSSLQRRQRRNGHNRDEPHSSSGNWSASSESGRASIGSEITSTTHPKSTTSATTSSNSLNFHPPSSVNSRRRFNFNTSTSSSVTSEGSTLTPDIIHDLHEDGDSVYSCDTEGYYTSFHMDSGLKTLKEEELLPSTPLQSTSAFCNSDSNNTVMSAENEYELFGKGSTSTTTSSAGTVCTTLRASESSRSLIIGPAVPERKSSLSKLSHKSSKSPDNSQGRDYVDKTGTIKRSPATNNTKPTVVGLVQKKGDTGGDVSPDSGHNTSSSPIDSVSSPTGVRSGSDFEFSESSDMEGPERIERIRVKTTINSSRIPSMCAITPPHSDDESSSNSSYKRQIEANNLKNSLDNSRELDKENGNVNIDQRIITTSINGTQKRSLINVNTQSGYATVENLDEGTISIVNVSTTTTIRAPSPSGGSVTVKSDPKPVPQPVIKSSLLPLNNMFGKLKSNLTNLGLSKRERSKSPNNNKAVNDQLSDSMDEYVTLADVRNNNEKFSVGENTYCNDIAHKNLSTVLSGKMRDAEYVSLNELPHSENNNAIPGCDSSLERTKRQGARVMLDAEGKVVYSSDSLRRRKPQSTFEPGPFVKLTNPTSPRSSPQMHRAIKNVRPAVSTQDQMKLNVPQIEFSRPMSPVSGNKVIIKASGNAPEVIRSPSTVVQPASPKMRPLSPKGAYVHVQAPGGSLSPKESREGVTPPISSSVSSITGRYPTQEDNMFSYANNDGYYTTSQNYYQGGNYYSTLPAKKSQYFIYEHPERSVTPDITRGLERPTNSLPRGGTFRADQNLINFGETIGIPVNVPHNYTASSTFAQQSHSKTLASNYEDDSLKMSPIDPVRNSGGFKSSTPQIRAATNLESKLLSPKRSTMSNEELYAVIHKTKKKLNIEDGLNRASPPAGLEPETTTPKKISVETGYIGTRQSWSPSKGEYIDFNADIDKFSPINEPKTRQSWACSDRKGTKKTSTLDFKRLLLQKSSTLSSNKKMSAVEQLKLSKQQMQQQKEQSPNRSSKAGDVTILDLSSSPRSLVNRRLLSNPPGSPERTAVKPTPKMLSPRSQWRFLNPRSDVLSSTILEDCREDDNSSNASRNSLEKRNAVSLKDPVNNAAKPIQRSCSKQSDNSSSTRVEQKPSTKYSTVSERLSAQRAQFFGTNVQSQSNDGTPKVPPTLETAF